MWLLGSSIFFHAPWYMKGGHSLQSSPALWMKLNLFFHHFIPCIHKCSFKMINPCSWWEQIYHIECNVCVQVQITKPTMPSQNTIFWSYWDQPLFPSCPLVTLYYICNTTTIFFQSQPSIMGFPQHFISFLNLHAAKFTVCGLQFWVLTNNIVMFK